MGNALNGLDIDKPIRDLTQFAKELTVGTVDKIDKNLQNVELIGQDTVRTGATVIDNIRADGFYTLRDFKSEFAAVVDSAIDNVSQITNHAVENLFDTVQMGSLLIFSAVALFTLFYGDKLFAHGIRLGKISFL